SYLRNYLHSEGIRCKDCSKYSGRISEHEICNAFEPSNAAKEKVSKLKEKHEIDNTMWNNGNDVL
ncbi:MAG: hypothetical protein PHU12_02675, partial [Candidatus Aenigmarchaeota archaeon]|nr:hypothetical protein [Candidatus Aenigmarchaeota archaeon]